VVTEQERVSTHQVQEEVCGQKTFTEVEDRPVVRERVERIMEHRPVEKQVRHPMFLQENCLSTPAHACTVRLLLVSATLRSHAEQVRTLATQLTHPFAACTPACCCSLLSRPASWVSVS
jgi:hypothetical protein